MPAWKHGPYLKVNGDMLSAVREERGLTVTELARRSAVSLGVIYRSERSTEVRTAQANIIRLAEALDCRPSSLVAGIAPAGMA